MQVSIRDTRGQCTIPDLRSPAPTAVDGIVSENGLVLNLRTLIGAPSGKRQGEIDPSAARAPGDRRRRAWVFDLHGDSGRVPWPRSASKPRYTIAFRGRTWLWVCSARRGTSRIRRIATPFRIRRYETGCTRSSGHPPAPMTISGITRRTARRAGLTTFRGSRPAERTGSSAPRARASGKFRSRTTWTRTMTASCRTLLSPHHSLRWTGRIWATSTILKDCSSCPSRASTRSGSCSFAHLTSRFSEPGTLPSRAIVRGVPSILGTGCCTARISTPTT